MRSPRALLSLIVFFPATIAMTGAQVTSSSHFEISNGRVRVEARIEDGRLRESYSAIRDGHWVVVATARGGSAGASTATATDGLILPGSARELSVDDGALHEELSIGSQTVTRRVALCAGSPWAHVTTRLSAAPGVRLHSFVDTFTFVERADWSYAPSVGGFIPDDQYKAPLILVQSGRTAFGIVPDVTVLDRATLQECNHSLDLDVPGGPRLTVGFVPARFVYHSVYGPDPSRSWPCVKSRENAYYLLVAAEADPGEAYREAVRFHWKAFGRPSQLSAARQQVGTPTPASQYAWLQTLHRVTSEIAADKRLAGLELWDAWRPEVWDRQTRERWLQVPLPGGTVGGGVSTLRWGPGPSVYLSAWFNTLRTSFGMALYARRAGDNDLLSRACQTLELALKAPGVDGSFKCVAVPGGPGGSVLWAAGDGSGTGTKEGYLGYDMSWTGYWLLRWRAAGLPGGDGILTRCRALAGFLCDRQYIDGMLPTRFAEDGSVDPVLSQTVKAETGPASLFLLELYRQDPNPRWLEAGVKGLAYLKRGLIPRRQWFDFETFWSCSPRTNNPDARTGQWPANDLALGQTVAAFLSAYQATHDGSYLDSGERLLDYLLLYQQCWTNPRLDDLTGPDMLLGGFTTQNSDAEWSDARQSQDGNVLLDYYRATGNVEYLERGVAALRAQFPVSPSENWAHIGHGGKTGISSFHWGTGSGMAGIEIEQDYLQDAVVDVASGQAVGVNGIDVGKCVVRDGVIQLEFTSPFAWHRAPVFAFHGCHPGRSYRIFANLTDRGRWSAADLERGIPFPLTTGR